MEESFRIVVVLIVILIAILILLVVIFGWLSHTGTTATSIFDWAKGIPSAGSVQPPGPGQ